MRKKILQLVFIILIFINSIFIFQTIKYFQLDSINFNIQEKQNELQNLQTKYDEISAENIIAIQNVYGNTTNRSYIEIINDLLSDNTELKEFNIINNKCTSIQLKVDIEKDDLFSFLQKIENSGNIYRYDDLPIMQLEKIHINGNFDNTKKLDVNLVIKFLTICQ